MAYNDMTIDEMIEQATILLKPQADGGVRELWVVEPLCMPYEPLLKGCVDEMIGSQVRVSALEPVIKQLTVEIGDEDSIGDGTLSAARSVYQGARALMDDPSELDAAFEAAFDGQTLQQLVNMTYSGLGGQAKLMRERLKPEHWAALERVNLDGVTLKDVFERWLALAESISAKDSKRKQLGVQLDDAVSRKQALQQRHRWIQVIRGIEGAIALSGLDERTRAIVLSSLHNASEQAGKRRAAPTPA